MAASNHQVASYLNNLIQICRDGQEGLRLAAEAVKDSRLRVMFRTYSRQRAELGGELQNEVFRLGESPVGTGRLRGTVHRGWLNLKSTVIGQDEAEIISECERGEHVAVNAYDEVLDFDLPKPTQELVKQHFIAIKSTHNRIRDMERALARGPD